MVFKKRFRTEVFQEFLRRLARHTNRKVFLIVDGHPVNRAKKIKEWVENNHDHIRLFFLPGYSPELNPDELLNQDVKSNAVGKLGPRNQKVLLANVRGYLRSRQCKPHVVKKYFQENMFITRLCKMQTIKCSP